MFRQQAIFKLLVFMLMAGLLGGAASAQSIQNTYFWYFGYGAGMDFNGGTPVALTNGMTSTIEGTASMSDASGNLLFYTDGMTVWDANHNSMPNGTGLNGGSSSTQSACIIPKPGSSTIYYIFTVGSSGSGGLYYSVVDMTLNGGNGDITTKNVLLTSPVAEKVTAVEHSNGTDYWIISHQFGNNTFVAYQVSAAGVNTTPVSSSVGTAHDGSSGNSIGQLVASPDGSKLACAIRYKYLVEIFDFDKTSGAVSNPVTINNLNYSYGVCFSPDNSVLYANGNGNLYQYDLTAANIPGSEINLASVASSTYLGSMHIGADCKIYMAEYSSSYLHVINDPNVIGVGCNFSANTFYLAGQTSRYGLANFPASWYNAGCGVLPVKLLYLTAYYKGDDIRLHWKTASEQSNDHFVIERGRAQDDFQKIGEVSGQGTTNEGQAYTYTDREVEPGTNYYYRLKQVDENGTYRYSKTVTASVAPNSDAVVYDLYPNPVQDQLSFSIDVKNAKSVEFNVFNIVGQVVLRKEKHLSKGQNKISLPVDDLPPGTYYFKVKNGPALQYKKFVKH